MVNIIGTPGPDTLTGGNPADSILGLGGNDTLLGNGGDDTIRGGEGNDSILGGDGTDSLYGDGGDDYLNGGGGNNAGNEAELLDGGTGNDFLVAGPFTRIMAGGDGTDTIDITALGTLTWTNIGGDSWTGNNDNGRTVTVSGGEWYINGSTTIQGAPCFASGTLVATARGEVAVEDLHVGDLVLTAHGGAALQPVVWIGHSKVNVARQPNRGAVAPILIKAGALAEGVPHRDLRVSPEHAMFLDGHLVPAKHLVNGSTIVQEMWCPEVTYWHVELPAHGLLVAEGAVSESYFDDGNRKNFDNHGISTLFKDFESDRANGTYAEAACYPLLQDGALLERIRLRLNGRVIALESASDAERRSA